MQRKPGGYRNSVGVELDPTYCQQAASRLLNENTNLFGNAVVQIDSKPPAPVEPDSRLD